MGLNDTDAVLEEARFVAEREAEKLAAPVGPAVAKCRSCGAPIYWAITGTGSSIPIDVEPRPDGNLSLRWNGRRILAVFIDASHPGPKRWPHHGTCPQGPQWRRKR